MQYNDVSGGQGIVQEIDFLVNTDSVKFPIEDKTRIINRWYERTLGRILETDGRWQFDDTNYITLPIATTNLVLGQQDYAYDPKHLRVTRMEIQDTSGQWRWLQPIDQNDVRWTSITQLGAQTGTPQWYDKLSNSVFLYPRPNYNATAGLKVYYERMAELFTITDTTKQPGFANIFHRLLAVGPAYEYATANNLNTNKIKLLRDEVVLLENDIKEFYSKKSKDEQVSLQTAWSKRRRMFK